MMMNRRGGGGGGVLVVFLLVVLAFVDNDLVARAWQLQSPVIVPLPLDWQNRRRGIIGPLRQQRTTTATATRTIARYHCLLAAVSQDGRQDNEDQENDSTPPSPAPAPLVAFSRRAWGERLIRHTATLAAVVGLVGAGSTTPLPARALVKGVAPPQTKQKPPSGGKPKCTNIDECQAAAELRERELAAEQQQNNKTPAASVTPGGTRYLDTEPGNGKPVAAGDEVTMYYKVLKLGKRSYDGLSGEGTVVFSRGYGLEDDEDAPMTRSFVTTVGGYTNIAALNEALVGARVGGVRRFSVLPQKGWRKPGRSCDGGPGGSGTGGDVKTDYAVVPTAKLVAEEACFDARKQPFPSTYAQQRRMAQRFDQSLIMEVEVVAAGPSTSGL